MDTVYKLVTQDMTTHGGYRWTMGKAHKPNGKGAQLCGPGVLHAYDDPLVGLFRNPADADIQNPRILVCEAEGERLTDGLKCGYQGTMTPVRELTAPTITTEHRVRFAIGCGMVVCHQWESAAWVTWAHRWLDGTDRNTYATYAAATYAAYAAAYDAADANAQLPRIAAWALGTETRLERSGA